MGWNAEMMRSAARAGAGLEYEAFEAIGLSEMEHAQVLDAGCFDGYNTHLLFACYGNIGRIVGLDPNARALECARCAVADERFVWENGSIEDFDGPEGAFDLISFSHSLQHVADKERALSSAYRACKPGGFVVVKTVDDSLMLCQPDPQGVVPAAIDLYDTSIRPHVDHTRATDRFFGLKCQSLLVHAGFESVRLAIRYTDTASMDAHARIGLFDRLTYFRNPNVSGIDPGHAQRMEALLGEWRALMLRKDVYFATATVMAVGRKPCGARDAAHAVGGCGLAGEEKPFRYAGDLFGSCAPCAGAGLGGDGTWRLLPMAERDLAEVLEIESRSFPNPWSPLAFAMELRHNACARYVVARSGEGELAGYIGVWVQGADACITRVAVAPFARRCGLGTVLMRNAFEYARECGAARVALTVRAGNRDARLFYSALGFEEASRLASYYDAPSEDGIYMCKCVDGSSADESVW